MPVIARFGGYVIRMYFEDHPPAHVHVVGPDFEALVRLEDGAIFEGGVPPRHRRQALDWIAENAQRLLVEWEKLH